MSNSSLEQDKVRFSILPAYNPHNPNMASEVVYHEERLTVKDKAEIAAPAIVFVLALAGVTYMEPQVGLMLIGAISGWALYLRLSY